MSHLCLQILCTCFYAYTSLPVSAMRTYTQYAGVYGAGGFDGFLFCEESLQTLEPSKWHHLKYPNTGYVGFLCFGIQVIVLGSLPYMGNWTVGVWYIHRPQSHDMAFPFRPKCLPYHHMNPSGSLWLVQDVYQRMQLCSRRRSGGPRTPLNKKQGKSIGS